MKPPKAEWRSWLYGIAWLAGGIASFGFAAWLVTLIRWDWAAGTEAQRLSILGNALYGVLATGALVTLGLTMRNAIRNFKMTAGAMSAEASGHEGEGQ
jgi:hypothetical protein